LIKPIFRRFLFLSILLCALVAHAQSAEPVSFENENDISQVKYKGELSELVLELTKNSKTELEKARAIFVWITSNISYDYKLFNKNKRSKHFKCKDKYECDLKLQKWNNKILQRILNKKKAICSGFSDLFKKMCDIAGIEAIVIEGYIKNQPSQIGRMGILDHAWNAVVINNQYYYLDATWAAGYCTKKDNGKLNGFVRKYNGYYWLTPVDKLSRNHFPKDTLKLVNSTYNKKLFKKNPYIEGSKLDKIEIVSPVSGVLNPKVGDTIHFAFQYSDAIKKLQINTNLVRNPKAIKFSDGGYSIDEMALKKQKYVVPKVIDGIYSFDYIVEKPTVRFIEILFDYRLALKYVVKVTP